MRHYQKQIQFALSAAELEALERFRLSQSQHSYISMQRGRGKQPTSQMLLLREALQLGLRFEGMHKRPWPSAEGKRCYAMAKRHILSVTRDMYARIGQLAGEHELSRAAVCRELIKRGLDFAEWHLPRLSADGINYDDPPFPLEDKPSALTDAEMRRMEAESCGRYAYQPDGTRVDLWLFQDAEWRREYAPSTVRHKRDERMRQWKEDLAARRAARGD